MGQFAVGQPVPRTEDPRLLRGGGNYINDMNLPGQAYGYTLRSPHAHADIKAIDTTAAGQSPGVLGVFTGADVAADGMGTTTLHFPLKRPDGSPVFHAPHPGLVVGRARFVGDPVAFIVAETLAQAKDAAELIAVDYAPLPSVTATAAAPEADAPRIWDGCDDNISHFINLGDEAAADAAIEAADHVISQRYYVSRVSTNAMEPRGAIGDYNAREDHYTLYTDIQGPHALRRNLAEDYFKLPENKFRVVAGDIGGAFGLKGPITPELRLSLWASRKVGRPVKWACDRSESFHSDEHARDNVSDVDLALDKDGKFLALRVRTYANVGAYLSHDRGLIPTFMNLGTLAGVYTTGVINVQVKGVFSNTNPTAPFRGAGRPEAAYILERTIDLAARKLGIDRAELRRRNTISVAAMPYQTALSFKYDCGEFEKNMDMALDMIDYPGFEARREEARKRGKLRGIGVSNTIERAASAGGETVEIRFDPTGSVTLLAGSKDQGQGHDTMYKQLISAKLGIDSDDVRLVDGDTDMVSNGTGTFGSRTAVIGGSALYLAADKIIEKGKKIAAHVLEASESDISFADGTFTITGTDRSVGIKEIAQSAFVPAKLPRGLEPGLYETGTWVPEEQTFPNGCHVVELEIDEETGQVEIVDYAVVDDVGNVINPLLLKGQIHGGIAQGVGQALMEDIAFDEDSGQLLTGSFLDYCMPRADDFCAIKIKSNPVPTKVNPLGVKGAGEAGTVGALPSVLNAVADALSPLGIDHVEMPATPEKIWQAIQDAKAA